MLFNRIQPIASGLPRIPLMLVVFLAWSVSAYGQPKLTLPYLLKLLEPHNPSLAAAQARRESAQGAMVTAQQYPNPNIEGGSGQAKETGYGGRNGTSEVVIVSQPLDYPFIREARRKVAEAGIVSADESNRSVWLSVRATTRQAFYEILRRRAELEIAEANERLLQQIRDKVQLKVEVGEAPRYEEVKAMAEWMNAIKIKETAEVRVEDAKSALHALFGSALPYPFDVEGELPPLPKELPTLEKLREEVLANQPLLQQTRAEVERARAKLGYEQDLRYPQITVIGAVERDPGLQRYQLGLSLPLPLWNLRQGQIKEATADLSQSEAAASQLELTVLRDVENAWNRYRIAHRQVETFESGLLKQAENSLKVAEAAYRLGERGILDYLDAQRVYRSVSIDYMNARFDRQTALIDLDRLQATDLKDNLP